MSNTTQEHCSNRNRSGDPATQRFETKALHAGYDRRANADAVSVPIYASAAFDLENARRSPEARYPDSNTPGSPILRWMHWNGVLRLWKTALAR